VDDGRTVYTANDAIPEIVFEFSITVYTIAKGFRASPILAQPASPAPAVP
jgi:hypothetical protein